MDNGAHFDGEQSGTVNGVTPPAVQHLTAEVTADSGEYQVLARWDTPKVVKGVSFLLRLTVTADDGSERLVSTARTTETTYRFTQLALGNYRLTVRAVNAWGQQGDPASVSFRIAAPAAPSRIELTPGYFQITATPHLAVYDPTVQFEFWFSEKRITDIRQVETTARYLGTGLYWIAASINIRPGYDYYFYVRSVNTVGKSAFVEAVGQPSDDASGYMKETTTARDESAMRHTSVAWSAGIQINPAASVVVDIAYEGSGSGDWRTDGFIVGVGYKF